MTIFYLLVIMFIILTIISIIGCRKEWLCGSFVIPLVVSIFFVFICTIEAISQPIEIHKEKVRYDLERQQIMYQIEHLTDEKDKVKLNEWILRYNDWVNDVNTEKQVYGWFAWYRDLDMSNHKTIDLV